MKDKRHQQTNHTEACVDMERKYSFLEKEKDEIELTHVPVVKSWGGEKKGSCHLEDLKSSFVGV